jgi:hypothetical protein
MQYTLWGLCSFKFKENAMLCNINLHSDFVWLYNITSYFELGNKVLSKTSERVKLKYMGALKVLEFSHIERNSFPVEARGGICSTCGVEVIILTFICIHYMAYHERKSVSDILEQCRKKQSCDILKQHSNILMVHTWFNVGYCPCIRLKQLTKSRETQDIQFPNRFVSTFMVSDFSPVVCQDLSWKQIKTIYLHRSAQ